MLGPGCGPEAIIEGHEWDRLRELLRKVQAARELERIGRAKRMPLEQGSRSRGHLGKQLDDVEGGEIG